MLGRTSSQRIAYDLLYTCLLTAVFAIFEHSDDLNLACGFNLLCGNARLPLLEILDAAATTIETETERLQLPRKAGARIHETGKRVLLSNMSNGTKAIAQETQTSRPAPSGLGDF